MADDPPPHPAREPRPGQLLGPYRLTARLGRGGMGLVFAAEDTLLKRRVALKVLPGELADDEAALHRFRREAELAARLRHPNVVTIFAADSKDGCLFVVMELLPGGSLQDLIDACGKVPWPQATLMLVDACRGLEAAHAAGLVHRDIKPSNLLRADDGSVRVADFGLVKAADAVSSLTRTGTVMGTPDFMSPEQCQSQPVDARSDLYSLGATYYYLLTGHPPYRAATPMQVMFAHCSKTLPDPRREDPSLPEKCTAIVSQALAKRPTERYASAAALRADLEALLAAATPEQLAAWQPPALPVAVEDDAPTAPQGPRPARPPAPLPGPPAAPALPDSPSRRRWLVAAGLVLLIAAVVAFPFLPRWPDRGRRPPGPFTLKKRETLKLHGREVRTVAIAPDGKRLATAGRDGIVGLWELPSGRLIQRIEADPRDTYTVAFVDRQVFASAGEGRKIRFWSAADGAPLHEIPIGGSVPFDLAFSGDGTRMAVALGYAGWGLWEGRGFRSLKERYRRPFDKGGAMALTLREDGAVTVYSYMDDTVSLWDAAEGQERSVLKPPPSLTCFAHVPGGRSLVVGTKEGEVRVWQPGGALGPPLLRGRGGVQCLAVSADGGTILSGCNETPGRVHLWRLALGEEDMLETGDGNAVRSLAISPDDRLVVSGSTGEHGAAVVLWDVVDPSPDR